MGKIIGIDLGTTNSVVAIMDGKEPKVIVNEERSQDTKDFINRRLTALKNQRNTGELEDLALVIGKQYMLLKITTN